MTITECCILSFKAGADITDSSSDAYHSLAAAFAVIRRQPGYQELWIGPITESADQVHLYINWDSLGSHQAYIDNQTEYAKMGQSLEGILAGPPEFIHVDFEPFIDLHSTFSGPVTELCRLNFPLDTDKDKVTNNFKTFRNAAAGAADGWGNSVAGWAVEEVENEKVGGKALVFGIAISWPSVKKHMAFRASEPYKAIASMLVDGVDLKDLDMVHVMMAQKP